MKDEVLLAELQKAQAEFLNIIDKAEYWDELVKTTSKETVAALKDALMGAFTQGFMRGAEVSVKILKENLNPLNNDHTVH